VNANERVCKRCGRTVSRTPSGHLRAHFCDHGAQCVVPYSRRRLGEKPEHCTQCVGHPDTRLDPGQLPMPFLNGIRPALRRPPSKKQKARGERWPLPTGGMGRPCPGCGCDRFTRCTVTLEDGAGTSECLPAGTYGRKLCSACRQPALPFAANDQGAK
jgi:hypothetical protein